MIVGLTGGIGSGKSSAAKFFIELGIDVIDADEVSKNILDENLEAKDKFLDAFGKEFLDINNKINRSLLRSEIFKDEEKKTLLESIIHPLVREQILKFIENLGKQKLISQASLSSMRLPKRSKGGASMKGFRVFVTIKKG